MMAAAMVAMVYSRHYLLQHALLKGEYFVLVMLSILGMMVTCDEQT
jgi:NADH-quinone oxidoreductase subunit N